MAQQQTQEQIDPRFIDLWRDVVDLTRLRYPDLTDEQVREVAGRPLAAEVRRLTALIRSGERIADTDAEARAAAFEVAMADAYAEVTAA